MKDLKGNIKIKKPRGERARPKGEGQLLLLALPIERVKEGIGEGISSLGLKDFQVR